MDKIKKLLKNNTLFMTLYRNFMRMDMAILTTISPVYASKYIYKKKFKKSLDLNNPKTYNEKLMWLKLFWREPLKSKCADKYEVREYIKVCGEEQCLNDLYDVYDDVKEINWDKLPNEFVLKVTNTCGANIICDDKNKLDKKETLKKLDIWMKDKYYLNSAEIHYKNIKPRIICEKYLKPKSGLLPIDYKVYCFNGEPKAIMICTGRETGNNKFYLCDLNGKILPFNIFGKLAIKEGQKYIKLPTCSKEMFDISKKLSAQFPYVRMDYYDYNGKVIFGEMTFTPAACLSTNVSDEGEKIMGEWIKLPKKIV